MKTDTLFYRLFQTDPSLTLELAGLPMPVCQGVIASVRMKSSKPPSPWTAA